MSANKIRFEKERKKEKRSNSRETAIFIESWKNIESLKILKETESRHKCEKCGYINPSFVCTCNICGSLLLPNL